MVGVATKKGEGKKRFPHVLVVMSWLERSLDLRGALTSGFVKEDGGGCGGVERFDGGGHGDADASVGGALDVFGEALAFVADEKGYGAAPVDLPGREEGLGVGVGFAGTGGHDVDLCGAELFDSGCCGVAGEYRDVERRSGGGAEGFGSKGAGGAALTGSGSDGGGSAEGGGGAEDGADVAGVLDADKDKNERGRAAFAGADDFVDGDGARSDEGGDALGIFRVGDAFEEAVGGVEDGDGDLRAIEVRSEASVMAGTGFAEKYGADRACGAEGFFDEARAFDADGAGFGGKSAAESHAELLEPFVVARGDEGGRR